MREMMFGRVDPSGSEKTNRVYAIEGICPTLNHRDFKDPVRVMVREMVKGCAFRGRGKERGMEKNTHNLEVRNDDLANSLTHATKGSMVLEVASDALSDGQPQEEDLGYAIRKITPREAWRLMDFTDEDFDKAAEVVSPTRLYAAAGNSIVVACLSSIFSQLNIKGVKPWNDRTDDERYALLNECALGGRYDA